MPRAGGLLLGLGVLLLGTSCGRPEPRTRAAAPASRPANLRAKPPSPAGDVSLRVVERPAPDRAVIEASWRRGIHAEACAVELVLPEGAILVEGARVTPLDPTTVQGTTTWQVGFPTDGRALDAVVRLCVLTEQGEAAAEATVRLVDEAPR